MALNRSWRVRDLGGDVIVELVPAAARSDDVARSRRELEALLWRASDEPAIRAVLADVLGALSLRAIASPGHVLRAQATDDLRMAARSGRLVLRRVARKAVVVDEPAASDGPVEPKSAPDGTTTWFSLKVLDEVGDAVDGVDVTYSIAGQSRVVTTNGAGVARLDGVDTGSAASAGLSNIASVRDKLKPRWAKPRDPNIPTGDNVTVHDLHDALDAVSLTAETPATLVLTPFFQCNEIPGTHFEFGRSFVRSSALEPLARIAEALRGEDGRKGMIFGHTDLSGPEALNKELSERRAKALHALLTHDADAWEELFSGTADGPNWHEKWDLEEAQHMLNALGVTDDDGHPVNENGVRDEPTKQAIHRFQAGDYPEKPAEQKPLAKSDFLGVPGRRELFLAYAKRITREPVDKDRLSPVDGAPFMGCGEFNPLSLTVKDEESRRAVIFVFDPASEPQNLPCKLRSMGPCKANCGPLPKEPDPNGKPPYRCTIYKDIATKCPCQGGTDLGHDLVVRIPFPLEVVNGFHHVLIVESDDGTIQRQQTLKDDARALDPNESEIYFTDLPHVHQYRMRAEGVDDPYEVFPFTPFEQLSALSLVAPELDEQTASLPTALLDPNGGADEGVA
jgi:outer membrane protein OmpA-like peptidoglycan-associated protein